MQNIMLVKHHPSIQLAHLYEHLYCMELKKLFHTHGLYKFLDVSLQGTTFTRSGFIEIDIELYTKEALLIADEITKVKVPLDSSSISIAFTQLLAELEMPIGITSHAVVERELKRLNDAPWQTIDEFELFDARQVRRRSTPLHIAENKTLPARKIISKLSLDSTFIKSHPELLPLFWQITKLIALAGEDVLIQHGYYGGELWFDSTSNMAFRSLTLHVAHGNHGMVDSARLADEWITVIEQMRTDRAFFRLCREMQELDYINKSWIAPDANTTMSETGIYIGTKGWQHIATEENITQLLRHTSLEVRFGRQKTARHVTDIV